MARSDGVRAVQYALRAMGQPVAPDGIEGAKTQAAISALPEADQRMIIQLHDRVVTQNELDGMIFVPDSEVNAAIDFVSSSTGVPRSFFSLILPVENVRVTGGYKTTNSGSFRGLGQFNSATWNLLVKAGRNLPSFEVGSVQTRTALTAVAYLYLENRDAYVKAFPGRDFTDEIAYLYHNQGAPAARRYLSSGSLVYPKQSNRALSVVAAARSQHDQENWA